MNDVGWMSGASCKYYDPEIWFAYSREMYKLARTICYSCPVILECQVYSLSMSRNDAPPLYGIWGGIGRRQRSDPATAKRLYEEATKRLARKKEEESWTTL